MYRCFGFFILYWVSAVQLTHAHPVGVVSLLPFIQRISLLMGSISVTTRIIYLMRPTSNACQTLSINECNNLGGLWRTYLQFKDTSLMEPILLMLSVSLSASFLRHDFHQKYVAGGWRKCVFIVACHEFG